MFYVSLVTFPSHLPPTSPISSFQTSFFPISRPLTDQHEQHQRYFIFMTFPSECHQQKWFLWSLQQSTQKCMQRHNQYLSDPPSVEASQGSKGMDKKGYPGGGCAAHSLRDKQKRANKLNKHFIWFTGKIFSFFLINSPNANPLTLIFPYKLYHWE